MKNPYTIRPAEMKDFVGRKAHYRELHQLLKRTPSIILVIGIRGMGKASFLKNILHQDFELQPLFIEYNSKNKHEREFVIPDLYRNRKEIPEHSELVEKLNTLKLKFTFSDYSPSPPEHAEENQGQYCCPGERTQFTACRTVDPRGTGEEFSEFLFNYQINRGNGFHHGDKQL